MQKKNMLTFIVAIVIVVIVLIAYAIIHKPNKTVVTNISTPAGSSVPATVNSSLLITKTNETVGRYLADPSGATLYTDGTGVAGVTSCTGSCLTAWPAYQDKGATTGLPTNVGVITRSDNGEKQYTYKGMPLYFFTSDGQGEVTGNGVSGFSVAKP